MAGLITLRDLHDQGHSLGLYCVRCDRWSSADLAVLIARGLGERKVTATKFRCSDCGTTAEKQVRPPVPAVGAASAYIAMAPLPSG